VYGVDWLTMMGRSVGVPGGFAVEKHLAAAPMPAVGEPKKNVEGKVRGSKWTTRTGQGEEPGPTAPPRTAHQRERRLRWSLPAHVLCSSPARCPDRAPHALSIPVSLLTHARLCSWRDSCTMWGSGLVTLPDHRIIVVVLRSSPRIIDQGSMKALSVVTRDSRMCRCSRKPASITNPC
jgi:hypothetical protein